MVVTCELKLPRNMANKKLVVEVCHASNLVLTSDGQLGSSGAYVQVDFDNQSQRTKMANNDLMNPIWNEKLEFNISDELHSSLENTYVEARVYSVSKGSPQSRLSLGKLRVDGAQFKLIRAQEEGGAMPLISYALHKKGFDLPQLKGQLFLKTYCCYDQPLRRHHHEKSSSPEAPVERNVRPLVTTTETGFKNIGEAPSSDFDVRSTNPQLSREKVSHDLVSPMRYLFVNIVRARELQAPTKDLNRSPDPYMEIKLGSDMVRTRVVEKSLHPAWNEVFAFSQEKIQSTFMEMTMWDRSTVMSDNFLGYLQFEIAEIPWRQPPDSPLAPQWYRLEPKGNHQKRVKGEIMVSVWMGTQADEAFPNAWQSDSGGHDHTRSKVYLSPKLWYLCVHVMEAQDLKHFPQLYVKGELGFQALRTRASTTLTWMEDMVFVAAEPFEEQLTITVMAKVNPNKDGDVGFTRIPLSNVSKCIDHGSVLPKWYDLAKDKKELEKKVEGSSNAKVASSRIQLALSLEGGYHVMDESVHHSSDMKPTDKRLWTPAIGVVELGILSAYNLLPMKTREGKGCTDAYCVAKYGPKWVRTRTVLDSHSPHWNEQYTWDVYDPCTVLTVGVFDNQQLLPNSNSREKVTKDMIIGKVRVRLSTLETNRVYTHSYPLISLDRSGVKKKGELELAVRFTCYSRLNMLHAYIQPLLPKMHYLKPFMPRQQEILRTAAMRIVVARLARSEPPIRMEVVLYMLDVDSHKYSLRRCKANWHRITAVFSGLVAMSQWLKDVCVWKNPVTTVLVHILFLILVWYPELILPTVLLYMFLMGVWQYRFREKHPPHMDIHLSQANSVEADDLDEEFDTLPTSKGAEIVKARYDRLRLGAGQLQTVMGDLATQLERFYALLNWRDSRATAVFITLCFLLALVLYMTPFRVFAVLWGVYALRHPRFRDSMPSIPLNFFRRLPALADRLL